MICKECGDVIHPKRVKLGYTLCLECGEEVARQKIFTVVPMHKSNYVAVFNRDDLKGINNKGGLIK
jgi:RNA polymerase-binding transcription factor DksA